MSWVRQGREADWSMPVRQTAERGRSGKANPIARSNNEKGRFYSDLFFVIRSGRMRSHEKVDFKIKKLVHRVHRQSWAKAKIRGIILTKKVVLLFLLC